jgi:hypothetical protein
MLVTQAERVACALSNVAQRRIGKPSHGQSCCSPRNSAERGFARLDGRQHRGSHPVDHSFGFGSRGHERTQPPPAPSSHRGRADAPQREPLLDQRPERDADQGAAPIRDPGGVHCHTDGA